MKKHITIFATIAFVVALYFAILLAFYVSAEQPVPEYELPDIHISAEQPVPEYELPDIHISAEQPVPEYELPDIHIKGE